VGVDAVKKIVCDVLRRLNGIPFSVDIPIVIIVIIEFICSRQLRR